jgi:phosphoribosylanthranilate isomerase
VKVCGVTNVPDAKVVASAGASALGLVLTRSPRRVTLDQAREIADALRGELLRCAVFRDDEDDYILESLDALDVDMVQIHGALGEELLEKLRSRSLLVVKALDIEGTEFLDFDESGVDAVLIDGPRPGSGVAHTWQRLDERTFRVPVVAAGGLNANNVALVVATTKAWGVDCASGVECGPREKDASMVESYVTNARRALALLGA